MFEVIEFVKNPKTEALEVCFEPWGMIHRLAPGLSFRVLAVSNRRGELEVVSEESIITVYGWSGCSIRVYCGEELVDEFSEFPELPQGMSTRAFIGFMFGEPVG